MARKRHIFSANMIWGDEKCGVLPGSLPDIHDISEAPSIGSNVLGLLIDVRAMGFLGLSSLRGH